MFKPRIIPVLLLQKGGLYKTVGFKKPTYIGDPINAVKIFNDLKTDELVFLDIDATKENRLIDLDFVRIVGEEANMPFAVGGGIKSLNDIQKILSNGAEKVVLGSVAVQNPDFVKEASDAFGTSTIAVCIDVKKNIFGKTKVAYSNGKKYGKLSPVEFSNLMVEKGAGELIIQSVDKDGLMTGYDLDLLASISAGVPVQVVALGGAGSVDDLKAGHLQGKASALAAGSMFVYQGKLRGVLINYPVKHKIDFEAR